MSSVEALHTITKGFSEACNVNVFDEFEPVLLMFDGTHFIDPINLLEGGDMYESIINLVNTPGSMSKSRSFGFVAPARASKIENPSEKTKVMLYVWVESPVEITSGMWRKHDDKFEISESPNSEGPLHHMLKFLAIRATIDSMSADHNVPDSLRMDMESNLQKGVVALQSMMESRG